MFRCAYFTADLLSLTEFFAGMWMLIRLVFGLILFFGLGKDEGDMEVCVC